MPYKKLRNVLLCPTNGVHVCRCTDNGRVKIVRRLALLCFVLVDEMFRERGRIEAIEEHFLAVSGFISD